MPTDYTSIFNQLTPEERAALQKQLTSIPMNTEQQQAFLKSNLESINVAKQNAVNVKSPMVAPTNSGIEPRYMKKPTAPAVAPSTAGVAPTGILPPASFDYGGRSGSTIAATAPITQVNTASATMPVKASIGGQDYNRYAFLQKNGQKLETYTQDGKNFIDAAGTPVDFSQYQLSGKFIGRQPAGTTFYSGLGTKTATGESILKSLYRKKKKVDDPSTKIDTNSKLNYGTGSTGTGSNLSAADILKNAYSGFNLK